MSAFEEHYFLESFYLSMSTTKHTALIISHLNKSIVECGNLMVLPGTS